MIEHRPRVRLRPPVRPSLGRCRRCPRTKQSELVSEETAEGSYDRDRDPQIRRDLITDLLSPCSNERKMNWARWRCSLGIERRSSSRNAKAMNEQSSPFRICRIKCWRATASEFIRQIRDQSQTAERANEQLLMPVPGQCRSSRESPLSRDWFYRPFYEDNLI